MYDVAIIGAGFSGLAAGIRLAHFGQKVCIFERHNRIGGLNSYYRRHDREYEAGLHALTNFPPPGAKASSSPWLRALRQLRIPPSLVALRPQIMSEVRFPGKSLKFTNDFAFLEEEVAREFPDQIDRFRRFVREMPDYDNLPSDAENSSARKALAAAFSDPLLIEMLMCPVCFYGAATEDDVDFRQFVIMFRSLFLEGFSRPAGGVRAFLEVLMREFIARGGQLRLHAGIRRIVPSAQGPISLITDTGEEIQALKVFSSAGYPETLALFSGDDFPPSNFAMPTATAISTASTGARASAPLAYSLSGRLGYIEVICSLDVAPQDLGISSTIIFFNNNEQFAYRRPQHLVDYASGVICCPDNFQKAAGAPADEEVAGSADCPLQLRFTHLANYSLWKGLAPQRYREEKESAVRHSMETAAALIPDFCDHVVATDAFTPLTIERFTSRMGGAIYGSPIKFSQGLTPYPNVFLCGADQGMVGIVGALVSGTSMANAHVIYKDTAS